MPTLKMLSLPALVILYLATFGFLWITNDQQTETGQFTREIVSILMASGMVALVTSSVFLLQARETSQNEKRHKIYEIKLDAYRNLLNLLSKLGRDTKDFINKNEDEYYDVLTQLQLTAGPKVYEKFIGMTAILKACDDFSNEPQQYQELQQLILGLYVDVRTDLDVLETVASAEQESMRKALESGHSTVGRAAKRYFSDEEKLAFLNDYESCTGKGQKTQICKDANITFAHVATWKRQLSAKGLID